jgi:UDP-N-acetylmuramoylalanine--D-glutamate ligase
MAAATSIGSATPVSRSVLCVGLAKTGEAVATVLARDGARVTVVEEQPGGDLYAARADLVHQVGARLVERPDEATLDALVDAADLVVPSPGVRPSHHALRRAAQAGIAVRSELDLAAERIAARGVPLVAITGTNGKTTTTDLTARVLERAGRRVVCGGNIGTPLLALADDVGSDAVVVAEVSSFQLEYTTAVFRPRVAVLLNVAPDHLEWHGTFAAYADAKAKLFAHQRDDDLLVVNFDDEVATALTAGHAAPRVFVTLRDNDTDWHVAGGALCTPDGTPIVRLSELRRNLPHDRTNALCATAAAHSLGAPLDAAAAVLRDYEPMPHRVQLVAEHDGIRWYDDSKATNPHAVVRAASAFDSIVLLAGGLNKDLDLGALREVAPRVRAVVAFGAAAGEIEAAFAGARPVVRASSMHDVVRAAAELAQPGDVVLLSPGCASFDMYAGGYTERGDDFAREVRAVIDEPSPRHPSPCVSEER